MTAVDKIVNRKSSPLWVLIAAVPLAGAVSAIAYTAYLNARNRWFTLLFLVPILGPIIAYIITSSNDRYVSSMAEWFFLGTILYIAVLWALAVASLL